ncbi:DUF6197 family protein [Streptomyces sp. NPDC002402]
MSTALEPSPAAIADILDKAADHIDAVGWHQSYLYDADQAEAGTPLPECRVCILGAINVAATGTPRYGAAYRAGDEPLPLMVNFAQDAVARHLGSPGFDSAVWNDMGERTQDEVTQALRDAANARREAS